MKLALPAAALAIVAATFAWPGLLPDPGRFRLGGGGAPGAAADGLAVDNPSYMGIDDERRPYRISAASASRRAGSGAPIRLRSPQADLLTGDGGWVALTAESGVYDEAARTVDLAGAVTILIDRGYRIESDEARIDLAAGTAEGGRPVAGRGPAGTVEGEGFRVRDRGRRVLFAGRGRAVLRGAPGAGP